MVTVVLVPFCWGLAEATFFFIIPDVWLTGLTFFSKDWRQSFRAAAWAVAGALIGGLFVYWLGRFVEQESLIGWLDMVPGITRSMIERVNNDLTIGGIKSIFFGILRGYPYKLYAAGWGDLGGGIGIWLAFSILARGLRFCFSILVMRAIALTGKKYIPRWNRKKAVVFILFWIVFYVFYFGYYGW